MRLPCIRNDSDKSEQSKLLGHDGGRNADHPLYPRLDHPTAVGSGDKAYEGGDAFCTSKQKGFLLKLRLVSSSRPRIITDDHLVGM